MPLRPLTEPEIAIRPIRADDGDRLRTSHDRLSPETRYRRFLAAKPQLTSADARYLAEVDGCDHFALVATRPDLPDEPIVGVARFVRDATDSRTAEMAIVIGDAYQRQGLGTELVGRLAEAALERGITRFRATMFVDNRGIRRLLERLSDGPLEHRLMGSVLEVELGLRRPAAAAA